MTRSDRPAGLAVVLLALLITLAPAVALAGEGDVAAARALFTAARKLAAAGDYAAACPQFADSYKLDPGIGTNFNLADCEEHLGRTASAWLRFLDVAAATKAAGQPERERVARARAAALEPRLSKLVIKVPSPAPGLAVRRDGDVVPQRLWGVALPIDPGEHALEATAPGKRKWTARVTISSSADLASLDVPALAVEAPPAAPVGVNAPASALAPASGAAAKDGERRIPRLTLWLGAFGIASLATGTVFAVLMADANSDAKKLCTGTVEGLNNVCTNGLPEFKQHASRLSDAEHYRTAFYVGTGVGAASLLAATAWWWHSSRGAARRELTVAVAPMFGASGAQLGIEGAW